MNRPDGRRGRATLTGPEQDQVLQLLRVDEKAAQELLGRGVVTLHRAALGFAVHDDTALSIRAGLQRQRVAKAVEQPDEVATFGTGAGVNPADEIGIGQDACGACGRSNEAHRIRPCAVVLAKDRALLPPRVSCAGLDHDALAGRIDLDQHDPGCSWLLERLQELNERIEGAEQ